MNTHIFFILSIYIDFKIQYNDIKNCYQQKIAINNDLLLEKIFIKELNNFRLENIIIKDEQRNY